MQVCTRCGCEKEGTDFYTYSLRCKACHKEMSHARYIEQTKDIPKLKIRFDYLDKEIIEKMKFELNLGVPKSKVAKKYGINIMTLHHWIKNKRI
jgi:DNA invertase Pin-like site-specific DNA recombinase